MSVTVCWKPISKNSKNFAGGTSSSFAVLKTIFGDAPHLHDVDVPRLRAMAVAANDKFYDEIADTIERVGAIEVWGEW